jgi:signal transduction histidine kinase/CheY-like chemotaxis protein
MSVSRDDATSRWSLRCAAACLLLLLGHTGQAEPGNGSIIIDDRQSRYDLGRSVSIFVDHDGRAPREGVVAGKYDSRFVRSRQDIPNFAFTSSVVWIRFSLAHRARSSARWFLEIAYPVIDRLDLYYRDSAGRLVEHRSGDRIPFQRHEVRHHHIVFPMFLEASMTRTYYLRASSRNSLVVPLTLLSQEAFSASSYRDQMVLGIFYGILSFMFLYSMLLFLSLRETTYFYYGLMTAVSTLYFMSIHGHAQEYLWPDNAWWGDLAPVVLLGFIGLFLLLMVRRFLDLRYYVPRLDRFVIGYMAAQAAVIASFFFVERGRASVAVSVMSLLTVIVFLFISIFALTRKMKHAKYLLGAMSIFLASSVLAFLRSFGFLNNFFLILNSMEVGYALSMMIFSMVIGYRINIEKNEKMAAQAELLRQMRIVEESEERFDERLKAGRMESLSIFAGGLAHDFNNLLTAIMGNISLAKLDIGSGNPNHAVLDEAEKASLQAKRLTEQMLTFARGGDPLIQVLSISTQLREVVEFALRGTNIRIEFNINPQLRNALANEGQIQQMLHNIILNARDAMPGGGMLKITAHNLSIGGDYVMCLAPGNYIVITIADTGPGIPPENLSRVFDPYFSTKEKGSGLGLTICYSVTRRHRGRIAIDNSPEGGAIVTIHLPATDREIKTKKGDGDSTIFSNTSVLIMDDEEMILDVGEKMLQRLGIKVTRSRSGEEAAALYRAAHDAGTPFDAVILDLTIKGGLGGRETVPLLREIEPSAVLIVSSGYSNDPIIANYRQFGFSGVVPKPYRFEELAGVLRECLRA